MGVRLAEKASGQVCADEGQFGANSAEIRRTSRETEGERSGEIGGARRRSGERQGGLRRSGGTLGESPHTYLRRGGPGGRPSVPEDPKTGEKNYVNPWEQRIDADEDRDTDEKPIPTGWKFHKYGGPVYKKVPHAP